MPADKVEEQLTSTKKGGGGKCFEVKHWENVICYTRKMLVCKSDMLVSRTAGTLKNNSHLAGSLAMRKEKRD